MVSVLSENCLTLVRVSADSNQGRVVESWGRWVLSVKGFVIKVQGPILSVVRLAE